MYQENNNQSKNNLVAVGIGFFVIILVAGLIFFKIYFFGEKQEATSENLGEVDKTEKIYDVEKYNSINVQDLFKKINKKENIEIIDIREDVDFKNKHILNSKNIPFSSFDSDFSIFNKNKEYILIDVFGFTPSEIKIMDLFLANGFEKITYLEGGISAWENEYAPLINTGDPSSFVDQSKITYIKNEELKNILVSESNYLYIVDLRENNAFLMGHLKNAVNIPLSELEEKYKQIPSGKKIILYSEDDLVSFQGAVRLFDLGFFNVFTLSDGLNEWKQKGFEVVK